MIEIHELVGHSDEATPWDFGCANLQLVEGDSDALIVMFVKLRVAWMVERGD